ncbi:unnamed protein product [Trichobilharzia regenti]|nr:unnamed protein product [Trichobilharzia regenti]
MFRKYPFKATQPTGTTEDTKIQSTGVSSSCASTAKSSEQTNSTSHDFPSTPISDLLSNNNNTNSSSNASKQRKHHHRTRKEISNDTNSAGGCGTGTQQSAKSN